MFIKRKILIGLTLSILASSIASAQSSFEQSMYVGGELNHYTSSTHPKRVNPSVFFGIRWDNMGVEVGHNYLGKQLRYTLDSNGNLYPTDKTVNNFYTDATFKHSLNENVDLLGAAGLGGTYTAYKNNSASNTFRLKPRVGGGAQYNFTEKFAVRAMARYQTNLKPSISTGVVYSF